MRVENSEVRAEGYGSAVMSWPAPELHATHRSRPVAWGKFLWRGGGKLYLKGVTYGPLAAEADEDGSPKDVRSDFASLAASGINCVRVYTVPPRWLLDIAEENGLLVFAGVQWEEHLTFLDNRNLTRSIVARVRAAARGLKGHAALAGIAVGNEIPASIVRWHGAKAIERFLKDLY